MLFICMATALLLLLLRQAKRDNNASAEHVVIE